MFSSGHWALITGASSGLGEEFARQLASRGVSLVLTARSLGKLEELAAQLGSAHGIGTRVIAADLSKASGIDSLLAELDASGLAIDHVIGNAGFGTWGDFATSDPSAQRDMITLNCEAIVALTRALLPPMIARGRGGVLNVASTAAFQASPTFATYAATKAFVLSFTEALHEELRGTNVHAMAVCPGPVPTGFQGRAEFTLSKAQSATVMSAAETVRRAIVAYDRRRVVFVPGALNKLGAVLASLAPRPVARQAAHYVMRSAERAST